MELNLSGLDATQRAKVNSPRGVNVKDDDLDLENEDTDEDEEAEDEE